MAVALSTMALSEPSLSPGDVLGLRCWSEGAAAPPSPAGGDGIEVDLVDVRRTENVVRINPVRVDVYWTAFRPKATEKALHRLVMPLDLFLSRGLPDRLVVGVLSGRSLSAEVPTRSVTVSRFLQWEDDLASGVLELRRAALSEIDGWLRRLAPDLTADALPETAPTPGRAVEVAVAMCQHIVANFREAVYVADVARAANVHPQYAMTLFRETVGCTVVEYLTKCRVGEAQRLLLSTDATASEVAFASGFGSISQFYERFTSTCGLTPRQYRVEMRAA